MNEKLPELLQEFDIYRLGGEIYDRAMFYYAHGYYEQGLGLLLAIPDSKKRRNLALNISELARERHHFDFAYLAAHLAMDDEQKKKIKNSARQERKKNLDNSTQQESIDKIIRKMARMNGGSSTEHKARYDYCEKRVLEQIRSKQKDAGYNNILQLKSCIRNDNGALTHYYLRMLTNSQH